ncbi:MAG: hypothetical protein AB2L09_09630 [Coriobacteriia bacterium]
MDLGRRYGPRVSVAYVDIRNEIVRREHAETITAIETRSSVYPVAVIRVGRAVHFATVDQWIITREVSAMLETTEDSD